MHGSNEMIEVLIIDTQFAYEKGKEKQTRHEKEDKVKEITKS